MGWDGMGSSQEGDVAMSAYQVCYVLYCLAIFVPGGDFIVCVPQDLWIWGIINDFKNNGFA
jgi:hypothetical protein